MSNLFFIGAEAAQRSRSQSSSTSQLRLRTRDAEDAANEDSRSLLNDNQTALRLGVSPATLRSWRCRGIGPPYIKLGRGINASVRYNPIDLDEFLRLGRHVPSVRAASEE